MSSRMLSSNDKSVAVLLLVLTESFILSSAFHGSNNAEVSSNRTTNSQLASMFGRISVVNDNESSSDSSCTEELEAYSSALDAKEMWAQRMWDASTKMQSGILQGNTMDLGMYGQCVGIDGYYDSVRVQGKHCMIILSHDSGTLTSSICLPSSCNETHALELARSSILVSLANSSLGMDLHAVRAVCTRSRPGEFSVGEILTIGFFSAVALFMMLCTICDYVKRRWTERMSSTVAVNTLAKFSLHTNTLAIFDTNVKPGTMPAINGIRFLSACWIVGLHQRVATEMRPSVNSSEILAWRMSWGGAWILMSTFAPDNFFMMSGFLVSYLFFKKTRSHDKFNLPMMYLHRYIRLTPGVMVVGLFLGFIYHRIGEGPLWETILPFMSDNCRENWWINFFFVQNFLPFGNICALHSWYMAADMQLYLVTPIILYLLHRRPKYGLGVWGVFFVASIVTPALVIGLNGITMTGLPSVESFENYYIRSYTRASPYLIGVILGYYITTNRQQLRRPTVVTGWIMTCVIIISCYFALRSLHNPLVDFNLAFETFCAGFLRAFWSLAMAWIIYACTQGHGGVVARFLSLSIFSPLSRISFAIYLMHPVVIFVRSTSVTSTSITPESVIFEDYVVVMVLSILMSVLLNVFFETPVLILESILRGGDPKRNRVTVAENVKLEANVEIQTATAR